MMAVAQPADQPIAVTAKIGVHACIAATMTATLTATAPTTTVFPL